MFIIIATITLAVLGAVPVQFQDYHICHHQLPVRLCIIRPQHHYNRQGIGSNLDIPTIIHITCRTTAVPTLSATSSEPLLPVSPYFLHYNFARSLFSIDLFTNSHPTVLLYSHALTFINLATRHENRFGLGL